MNPHSEESKERKEQKPNHLIHESSPYLLQHAFNPVDWYPWGDEAFEKAKLEKKIIFLSIGYSTCHWCHVMAHESFESVETARYMNENFVSIKVDREERPDLDEIYQNVIRLTGRSGGWPLSIFMTPDRMPFFAGTYFPDKRRYGMISFIDLLKTIVDLYQNQKEKVMKSANSIVDTIKSISTSSASKIDTLNITKESLIQSILDLNNKFDIANGGFGSAPKFPNWSVLLAAIRQYAEKEDMNESKRSILKKNLILSLDSMSNGGIYDHLGGGFCRYSVDSHWLIPHFEKMLYDNAMALVVYSEAYRVFGIKKYKNILVEIIEWLKRRMYVMDKGFYSAMDADSEGEEGKYYVWTKSELDMIIPNDSKDIFYNAYGVTKQGNFENNTNNLNRAFSNKELSRKFRMPEDKIEEILQKTRHLLLNIRIKRVPPDTDTKIITAWNALLIHGLYSANLVLKDDFIKNMAHNSLIFILNNIFDSENKILYSIYDNKNEIRKNYGNLDTYAYLIQALFDDFAVYHSEETFELIKELIHITKSQFWDEKNSGFFYANVLNKDLLTRLKSGSDMPLPNGNGVMAENLLRMHYLTGNEEYLNDAEDIIKIFWKSSIQYPSGYGAILIAIQWYIYGSDDIAIISNLWDEENNELQRFDINNFYIPRLHFFKNKSEIEKIPTFKDKITDTKDIVYYICHNFNCFQPTQDFNEFKSVLDSLFIKT